LGLFLVAYKFNFLNRNRKKLRYYLTFVCTSF